MRSRRNLWVEQLESRRVLAGNVTAAINSSGNLVIDGDGLANDVSLSLATDSNGDLGIEITGATIIMILISTIRISTNGDRNIISKTSFAETARNWKSIFENTMPTV